MMAAVIAASAGRVSAQPPSQAPAQPAPASAPKPADQTPKPADQIQPVDTPGTVCGLPIPEPARLPPAGS